MASAFAIGCCASERSPSRAVNQTKQALNQADLERMVRLLVDDRGQPATRADINVALSRPGGVVAQAIQSAATHPEREQVTVRYGLANGSNVVLVKQGSEFRVRFAPMPRDCPITVLDALQAFRSTVVGQSERVSVGPLTNRLRMEVASETRALLDGLRYIEELEVFQAVSTAQVTLPSGHVIVLRAQDSCWRIDEVN